jgi:DNA-directed RNA polymerase I subunit RPA1
VTDYSYDTEKERWCEITLSFDISQKRLDFPHIIKKSAEKGLIYQVKNIKKGFVIEKNGRNMLQTDGINIDVMLNYDSILDLNQLMCNSIHDMHRYYGIEAAYKTIVREVTNVFGVYGIEVDYRHLSLIADYMTQDGSYKPFNRVGIESNPSPLQQMTFETAMGFLRSATLSARADNLSSPSACIVLGKTTKGGTGSVSLRQKV